MLPPIYQQARLALGSQETLFNVPMSRSARALLDLVLVAIMNRATGPGAIKTLLPEFAQQFNPAIYEDAVLGWDNKILFKMIKDSCLYKPKRQHTEQDILTIARMGPLFSKTWDIPTNAKGQFRFSNSGNQMEIYNYICCNFLLDDFHESDLLKLAEITKTGTLDGVKDLCSKIESADKRNVQYLYRVWKNESVVSKASDNITSDKIQQSQSIIAEIIKIARSPKSIFSLDPNWDEDAKLTISMREDD